MSLPQSFDEFLPFGKVEMKVECLVNSYTLCLSLALVEAALD